MKRLRFFLWLMALLSIYCSNGDGGASDHSDTGADAHSDGGQDPVTALNNLLSELDSATTVDKAKSALSKILNTCSIISTDENGESTSSEPAVFNIPPVGIDLVTEAFMAKETITLQGFIDNLPDSFARSDGTSLTVEDIVAMVQPAIDNAYANSSDTGLNHFLLLGLKGTSIPESPRQLTADSVLTSYQTLILSNILAMVGLFQSDDEVSNPSSSLLGYNITMHSIWGNIENQPIKFTSGLIVTEIRIAFTDGHPGCEIPTIAFGAGVLAGVATTDIYAQEQKAIENLNNARNAANNVASESLPIACEKVTLQKDVTTPATPQITQPTGYEQVTLNTRPIVVWNSATEKTRVSIYQTTSTTSSTEPETVVNQVVEGTSFQPDFDLTDGTYSIILEAINTVGTASDPATTKTQVNTGSPELDAGSPELDAESQTDASTQDLAGEDAAQGACVNPSDQAILTSQNVKEQAQLCTTSCVDYIGDKRTCFNDCFAGATGLSQDCVDCYADMSQCTVTYCKSPCVNPGATDCINCQNSNGCTPAFQTCSGLTPQ